LANGFLKLGIKKGDKIATVLNNCFELLEVFWAAAKIGAVAVPLSPLLRGRGLSTLIADSDAVLVVTEAEAEGFLDAVKPDLPLMPPERYYSVSGEHSGYLDYQSLKDGSNDIEPDEIDIQPDDPVNIIYSSGTTGLPKGIVHTHGIRGLYASTFASSWRMHPESICLHTGSIIFNGAFMLMMPAMYLGSTFVFGRHLNGQQLIEIVEKEKVTHVTTVPAQLIAMLNASNFSPEALSSLEAICCMGAPLHKKHKEAWNRHLPGTYYEAYGLTEGFFTVLDRNDLIRKPESVGWPTPFTEIKIVDHQGQELPAGEIGEILGRGPLAMTGYYKQPELTGQTVINGWIHSGDLGFMDDDGFLHLVDRMKDMIISGGINVYPRDIEEVIIKHPSVRDVAVYGVPSEKWGETPVAAVVLHQDAAAVPREILAWVNERVEARFQKVKDIVVLDEFPRTATGKVLKRTLRDRQFS
jgi:acyl-CoA synthetase (AMP-forming)/AMP-acid ligase II